ncbi:glutaminyl-peptide cyclotransferase [Actinomycetospora termitidis]|uniref:Glutaminyl-peptide cyclotransferase n=1 Tax=Actinomycetospora termitidis TaxID=3053470 RepID=A0ABT7M515_9PSEU|nr:glutaminyl-peptide cyclotransferase [Actinomycetospora sp. Odt1-22]MDL5155751.1 glutaminyl-peptide cyclotransferase [Actinomycetospora sp. Odt1-22]
MPFVLLALVVLAGCSTSAAPASDVTRLSVQVLGTVPHDPAAFTQGFEIAGASLWEGTGLVGRSQLRETDPTTGAVRRAVDLPADQFGEGITVTPNRIWQLTWKNGVVYDRDPTTLAVRRTLPLDREGWGICHTATDLVTSDGSSTLVFRDPETFAPRRTVDTGVRRLNELECTGSTIWANVWQTDEIVGIDPPSGRMTTVVDASALRPAQTRGDPDAVLNGIAAIPGTDEFLVTGKRWPVTYRVAFAR